MLVIFKLFDGIRPVAKSLILFFCPEVKQPEKNEKVTSIKRTMRFLCIMQNFRLILNSFQLIKCLRFDSICPK